jgi:hypothetical protein
MRMRWLLAVALALVALVAAGCGSDSSTSGSTETVATEATSTEETAAEETTSTETTDTETTGTETTDLSGILSEDCAELVALGSKFAEAFSASTSGQTPDYEASAKFFDEFADRVPEEIRADFRVVAENYRKIIDALKDVGPISAQSSPEELAAAIKKLEQATKGIDQAKVNAAATRIGAWANANCNANG